MGEFEGVSVFEFVFEGGWGERARSGAGWRFSSAMPKSSKTGQHGAQSVEQQERVLHVRLRSQSAATGLFLVRRQLRKLRRERIGTAPSGHFRSDWRPPRWRGRSAHLVIGRQLKLFSATRTAIARTRSSLEHELEHGHGLALATAHELGAGRRCD